MTFVTSMTTPPATSAENDVTRRVIQTTIKATKRGAKAIKTPSNYISHGLAKLHAGNSARVQPVPSDIGGDGDEIIET